MINTKDIFESALAFIKNEINAVSYKTWFSSISDYEMNGNIFKIYVPDEINAEILKKKYLNLLKATLDEISGKDLEVSILLKDDSFKSEKNVENYVNNSLTLNPKYTFSTFVVGGSNSFAHAAAVAVAELPAVKYNPLFIYGGVGLGKTHLTHAIGHHILSTKPNSKICYVTMDKFVDEFIQAIKEKSPEDFRNKYRNVDVLIVDDIQFIINKEKMQEEFFHTFNSLFQANKQIIITSDRPPKEIATLEERLRSRFESGLICDIQPPDVETRIAILQTLVNNSNINVPEEIIVFVAENIKSNIRELEGALNRVFALSELEKREITIELTKLALKDFLSENKKKVITCRDVIREVTDFFNLGANDLKSKLKTKELSHYRHIAMYLCRELTENSLPKIGDEFGGRDHTTVMHAINKINEQLKDNVSLRLTLDDIISNIKKI